MARTQWLHRNADVGTIEALDELDDDGSQAPGAGGFLIPAWARYITRIAASGALDGAAIGSGVVFGRLRGGLDNGDSELTFMISGGGVQVATGTQNGHTSYISPPLSVPVQAGARMKVFAEIFGDAENDTEASIGVQLSDTPHPDGCRWTRSFTADVDGVDTDVDLTGDLGSDANPPTQMPEGCREVAWLSGTWGWDQAADGTQAFLCRLLAGPVRDQQDIPLGGSGTIAGQTGSDETALLFSAVNMPVGSEASPLVDLAGKVRGEQMGDDAGSGQIGVTLWIR